jgi:porin
MRKMNRKTLGKPISHRVAVACAAVAMSLSIGWAWPSGADEPAAGTPPVETTDTPAAQEDSEPADAWSPGDYLSGDYLRQVWERDRLTGDWGGLRTDLNDHGIKPRARFSQFVQGVGSGGIETNGRYSGKVDWIVDLDVSKFLGIWPGLFINLHAETQYGDSVFTDAGPSSLPNTPMLLPLPNCACTEITNLTIMQGLWEGSIPLQEDKGAVVLAAGKLNIVDLLTTSFPNFANGLEGFLNFNALYPAWPYLRFWFISQYGASLALFNEDRGMPQVSFLVYGQDNVSAKWDISDSFSDGVGLMGLFRVFWDWGDKQGYAAVLASGSTKEYSAGGDIAWEPPFPGFDPVPSLVRDTGNPWQVNPFLYQEIWRGDDGGEHERKVYLWLTGAVADKSPSFARWSVLGTVEALGPLASRPMDRMGFAGWYTAWNGNYERALRLIGVSPRNVFGFEVYYSFAINRWLRLTADLQLVQNLDKAYDLAVIPGARLVLEF